jgi:hypothetical protein
LPDVFKQSADKISDYINIMPIGYQNNEYTFSLGRFNAYQPLSYNTNDQPEILPFPDIQTVSINNISSENTFIDVAYTSGMLDKAFDLQLSKSRLMPVMHGRMGSGEMNFKIGNDIPIFVKSAQLEIDATFESKDKIVVIEAKAVPETDFLVRQLFYPYYVIKQRGVKKPIIPTFLVLLAGNYYFLKYEFTDDTNYSSIKLLNQRTFRFAEDHELTLKEIVELYENTPVVEEPKSTFPQANSFVQMINVLSALDQVEEDNDGIKFGLNKYEIAEVLGTNRETSKNYNERQGDYYGNLIVYLGFGTKDSGKDFVINKHGKKVLHLIKTTEGRTEIIIELFKHKPFRAVFQELLNNENYKMPHFSKQFVKNVENKILTSGGFFDTRSHSMKTESNATTLRRTKSSLALLKSIIFDFIS